MGASALDVLAWVIVGVPVLGLAGWIVVEGVRDWRFIALLLGVVALGLVIAWATCRITGRCT